MVVFRAQFGAKARFQPGTITPLRLLAWGSCHWTSQGLDIARVGSRAERLIDPVFNNMKHIETPYFMSLLCYFILCYFICHFSKVRNSSSRGFQVFFGRSTSVIPDPAHQSLDHLSEGLHPSVCRGMSERIYCGSSQYVVNPTIMDDIL